eukprot:13951272-Alexandrium_andersonii.AAC.1
MEQSLKGSMLLDQMREFASLEDPSVETCVKLRDALGGTLPAALGDDQTRVLESVVGKTLVAAESPVSEVAEVSAQLQVVAT